MPLFDYKCTLCKVIFEAYSKNILESDLIKCAMCGTGAEKLLSYTNNLILRGEGFYKPTKQGD